MTKWKRYVHLCFAIDLETVPLDIHSLERPLFSLPVVDSYPCGHDFDDSNHYLLHGPLFYQARNMMINEIRKLTMTDFHVICCCMVHICSRTQ